MFGVYMRPLYQAYFVNVIAKWITRISPSRIIFLGCLSGLMVVPALIFHCVKMAMLFLLISGGCYLSYRYKVEDDNKVDSL